MKWSFATLGIIILGIIGLSIILLFQNLTTSSENDYYLLKEVTEAAMVDAIDMSYYRETGHLKIIKEKFIENFTRRYAESTLTIGTSYTISFFDIMEEPPKVTITINTGIENYRIYNTIDDYNVENALTGILEFVGKNTKTTIENINNDDKVYTSKTMEKAYYSIPTVQNGNVNVTEAINYPEELSGLEIKNIEITASGSAVNSLEEIMTAELKREIDWPKANDGTYDKTNYYAKIEPTSYASSCAIKNFKYYNCKRPEEKSSTWSYGYSDCNKYKDSILVHYEASCNKNSAIIKLNTKWSYKEYEYK